MGERHRQAQLSLKQVRFAKEFAESGNSALAARRAGYRPKAAKEIGYENLTKPHVAAAVKAEVARVEADYGPQRVKRRLHEISYASQEAGQFGPAVRSEELLGKSIGMWVEQSIALTGTMNDTHIAALLDIARQRQAEPIDLVDDQVRDTKSDERD